MILNRKTQHIYEYIYRINEVVFLKLAVSKPVIKIPQRKLLGSSFFRKITNTIRKMNFFTGISQEL